MRFRRRNEPTEEPCPRCGIPAPPATAECAACGWDMHESYHAEYAGSRVGTEQQETDAPPPTQPPSLH